ncbi:MAG: SDR family NAD(P)-dependent oxidoreductase [Microbacteriaceae bacterium]
MTGRLDGKVALVTGGARGIGAATARLFACEGAAVVIGDVLDADGAAVASEIRSSGGRAVFVRLDVTDETAWGSAMDVAVGAFGRLDVLVNNAGIVRRSTIEETSGDEWDLVMTVNAKGAFLGTKHAIPLMRAGGGGSIINVSSIVAVVATPAPTSAYGASKGAVRTFTKFTAVQHARDAIRCNSIHPGPIATAMTGAVDAAPLSEERRQRLPLGRLGSVDDIAYGALYLASDESSFVTGIELFIDGGTAAL